MKLTILGSGTPEAHRRRASSGYLVDIGDDVILFDCGGGVFDNLLRAGRMPQDVTHLVFSHLHSDHMMDYPRLVHAAWDAGAPPLRVWGPAPIDAITDKYFGPDGVLSHDLHARTDLLPSQEVWRARGGTLPRPWPAPIVTEIAPGDVISCEAWQIETAEAPHAQPVLTCMSMALRTAEKVFVYSGDTGICPPLEALCQDADLLLHWCYRFDGQNAHPAMVDLTPTPSEIAKMAQRCRVKRLLLTHIRVDNDTPAAHESALKNMHAHFDGPASIVEDLDVVDV